MKKYLVLLACAVLLSFPVHAKEEVEARLIFDIGPLGNHSWVLRGIKDGTFKRHGIDLEVVGVGPGSVKTGLAISAGKAEFGYQDMSGVMLVNGKARKPKFKAIFVVDDKAQDGMFALKSSGIRTWDDIHGKTTAGFITGTTRFLIPLVTKAKPVFINTTFAMRVPSLVTGKTVLSDGFMSTMKFNLEAVGVTDFIHLGFGNALPWTVSRVITVNSDWAEKNPQLVRNMRKAIMELIIAHAIDTKPSIDAMTGARVSNAKKRDLEYRRALWNINNLQNTPNTKKNGYNNPSNLNPRLKKYVDEYTSALALPYKHKYSDYFDLEG